MTIFVEMGNAHPQDLINNPDGSQTRKDLQGPAVTYVLIPDYPRGRLQGLERVDGQSDAEFEAADEAHDATDGIKMSHEIAAEKHRIAASHAKIADLPTDRGIIGSSGGGAQARQR